MLAGADLSTECGVRSPSRWPCRARRTDRVGPGDITVGIRLTGRDPMNGAEYKPEGVSR
jgi:hypothetical protein